MSDATKVSHMFVLDRVVMASLDIGRNRTSRDGLEDVLVIHWTDRHGGSRI